MTAGARHESAGNTGASDVSSAAASVYPAGDAPERLTTPLTSAGGAAVWRIPLPLPFALRSVNVYLVDGGPGARVLFDAGLGLADDRAALLAGLGEAGLTFADISALVLTHAHPDHIGLAGQIVAASSAPVYLLQGEEKTLYTFWGEGDAAAHGIEAMYAANGLPPELLIAAANGVRSVRQMPGLPPREQVTTLADGACVTLGGLRYTVYWTPGHSDYHMCLLREDGIFFAGDHILPRITPNIGYYPHARPNPLGDYYSALAAVRDLPATLVLPGHGRPFSGLAARVDELRMHHEERSEIIRTLLADTPDGADAGTVAGVVFGARLRNADDWRFALVETLAHLEYLTHVGHAERVTSNGRTFYRLLPRTTDNAA